MSKLCPTFGQNPSSSFLPLNFESQKGPPTTSEERLVSSAEPGEREIMREAAGGNAAVGCSFWVHERPQSSSGEEGECLGEATAVVSAAENDEVLPEWLPPILNTRVRKNAVSERPTTR